MSARSSLALITALALAACSNGGVVAYQDPANSADVGEIHSALDGRVTAVSVIHNPFPGMTDRQLAEIVAAETPARLFGNARFTGDPSQASASAYHLVWDFGASNGYSGDGGCGGAPAASTPPTTGPTNVSGSISLCRSGGPMTRAYGHVDQVSRPDENRFSNFVAQMSTEILLYPMPAGGKGGGSTMP